MSTKPKYLYNIDSDMDISTLIRQERKEYATQDNVLVHHCEINNGLCRMFARYFKSRAADHGIHVDIYEAGFETRDIPSHAWLEYNGDCYDSECPEGVAHPTDLPYYQEKGVDSLPDEHIKQVDSP